MHFTGTPGIIYNGIPNWFYANTPELKSETIAFSPDGVYLSYMEFNDSQVEEYKLVCILCPMHSIV